MDLPNQVPLAKDNCEKYDKRSVGHYPAKQASIDLITPASVAKKQGTTRKAQATFVLSGTIDLVDENKLKAIAVHLQIISGDSDLTILKVESGSIRIILEGSSEGLKRLEDLFQSGELTEVLGIPIEDVQLVAAKMSPASVFISYAHTDNESSDPSKRWLDRLLEHLEPLNFQEQVHTWSDKDIEIGANWHENIQMSLSNALAAVLLISPAFLASKYIRNSELPVLLKNALDKGLVIIPIILRPSLFKETLFKYPDPRFGPEEISLASLQSANSPTRPLNSLEEYAQDQVLLSVAQRLLKIVQPVDPHPPIPVPQAPLPPAEIQNRRLEAAMPKKSKVGKKTEVRVMIALKGSSGLRAYLPDWTEAGDLITKKDVNRNNFPLEFPVAPETGIPLPTNVFVTLTASDFEIEQASKIIRLSPKHDSGVVTFFLTPHVPQDYGIVGVELFKDKQLTILLSSLTLRTEISRQQDDMVVWGIATLPLATVTQNSIPSKVTALQDPKPKEQKTKVESKSVSETSKYDLSNAKFGGGFAGTGGTQIGGTLNDYSSNIDYSSKQSLAEAAAEIQQLLTNLQAQGYSQESAKQQAAQDLVQKAQSDPKVLDKLIKWGQSLGDTAAKTTVTTAVTAVVKLALKLLGVPLL